MTVVTSDLLPLLELFRSMTERFDSWAVWKNADSALRGEGDTDSSGPRTLTSPVFEEFGRWARSNGARATILCSHTPGLSIMVGVFPDRTELVQFDLWHESHLRGTQLFDWEQLVPLMELDPRGFRRLRPGAEGLLLLLFNGTKIGGRRNDEAIERKNIRTLLAGDPDGVALAVETLRLPRQTQEAAAAVSTLNWNRKSMIQMEGVLLGRAIVNPTLLFARLRFRARSRCPVTTALGQQRRAPASVTPWMREMERGHVVQWL